MASVKCYVAIDLKSFYASVECVERGLDPLTTPLVVADESRTDKTICLAVSPSLKKKGISGRARLFEVLAKVNRKDFICAVPRMQLYIDYSVRIYQIYLKYFSKDDIHVYSIDEVFIDVTHYLQTYNCTPRELATKVIQDVLKETGITIMDMVYKMDAGDIILQESVSIEDNDNYETLSEKMSHVGANLLIKALEKDYPRIKQDDDLQKVLKYLRSKE